MLELFRQCGILGLNCSASVIIYYHTGGTVQTQNTTLAEQFNHKISHWRNSSNLKYHTGGTVQP
jgi:hypothetical protein